MKQNILNIITTIIIFGVVISSLSLSVLSEETDEQLFVEYFPISSASYVDLNNSSTIYDLAVYDSLQTAYGAVSVSNDFQQYIGTRTVDGSAPSFLYSDSGLNQYIINLNYGSDWDNFDKSNINYIKIRFAIITPQGWTVDSVPNKFFNIQRNGSSLAHRYTTSVIFSNPVTAFVGTTQLGYYRYVTCNVLFDSDLNFNTDDVITFNIQAPICPFAISTTGNYASMIYQNGFDNLTVGYITTNQYLDQIAADVGVIGDKIDETNSILLDISDKLNEEITDEQQEVIDGVNDKIGDSESKGEYIEDNINDLASIADENAYDFEADDLQTIVDDNIQPVLDDEGFALFTEELFGNIWVYTSITLVLFFVFIRYVVYGVG